MVINSFSSAVVYLVIVAARINLLYSVLTPAEPATGSASVVPADRFFEQFLVVQAVNRDASGQPLDSLSVDDLNRIDVISL